MNGLKKHGDPLDEEIRRDPQRPDDDNDDGQLVRSADQKPNPNQPDHDATMEPGGDLGQKRNTM
jgi:hypothetical protein